jgi:hypothetical protein
MSGLSVKELEQEQSQNSSKSSNNINQMDSNIFRDILHQLNITLENNTIVELEKLYTDGLITTEEIIEQYSNQPKSKVEEKSNDLRKTDHLWISADEHIMPMLHCRTSIYLEIKICDKKIRCLLDTGAQNNIIKRSIIDELKLGSFVDESYKCKVIGVGENTGQINGIMPYIEVHIGNVLVPLYFNVMEKVASTDVILGLPFMMFYRVQLDFATNKMTIMGQTVDMIVKEYG